jgi:hypothetical protein
MKVSALLWCVVVSLLVLSVVPFVQAQTPSTAKNTKVVNQGMQGTPTVGRDDSAMAAAQSNAVRRIVRGVPQGGFNVADNARHAQMIVPKTGNVSTQDRETQALEEYVRVNGVNPAVVPNSGTLVMYPALSETAATGYDELFYVSPNDQYLYYILRTSTNWGGWWPLTGIPNVIGITSFTEWNESRIQYLDGTSLPCTTIGTGDSIFTNYAKNCTKIQNITQIINNPNGIDDGFVMTSSGKVIDFKAARTNLPTTAVKLAVSNPCAVALKSDKSIVVLNKSGINDTEYYYGDMRCYGLSALFSGRQYKDVSGYRLTDYYFPSNPVTTVNQMQFTTVDTAGEVVNYAYDGDSQTWGTTVVYAPSDDNLPNRAVGIPDDNTNAVIRLNDGSIIYAQTPQVNDVPCSIPSDIHDVVQLEIVNSYNNYQDVRIYNHTPALIKIAYALRSDNTLWRWKLPTTDTCYDSAEQLGTGIKQFAATAMGVTAIKTTFATDDLTIKVQPIENATLFTNSTSCGIYVYANGGVKNTASTAWNGIEYQWYYGISGDTSQPVIGAMLPALCTYEITDAGSYWVQIKDANTTLNSNTVNVSWLDVDKNHIAGSLVAWGDRSTQINAAAKSWRNVIKAGYWFAQGSDGSRMGYSNWGDTWAPWYTTIGLPGWTDLWRDVLDSTRNVVRLTDDYACSRFCAWCE